jgi:hypothetical protein
VTDDDFTQYIRLIENPLPWYDVVEEALFGLKLA